MLVLVIIIFILHRPDGYYAYFFRGTYLIIPGLSAHSEGNFMTDKKFIDFGLIKPINRALSEMDYSEPTPIQLQAIPPLLEGRDLIGCAQTGTGKTAAFSLPIIHHLAKNQRKRERGVVRSLIVTPTRELAAQIYQNLRMYSKHLDMNSVVIYGGVGQSPQVKNMNRGVEILVATPGRLLDLINQGHVDLKKVEILVLDEADRMLDMGFIHDIRRILEHIPDERQTMFFSATMPPKIVQLSKKMVHNPVRVDVTPDKPVIEIIDQRLMMAEVSQKTTVLMNVLKEEEVHKALVFTRTKHGANKLVKLLGRAGINAEGIHGNKSQTARQNALADFKSGKVTVLVATDIAARGIDVEGITHVINHDIPDVAETYVHRIGRTARAGSSGISVSLCSKEEQRSIRDIERLIKQSIPVIDVKPYLSNVKLMPEVKRPQPKPKVQKQHGRRPYNKQGGRSGGQGGKPGNRQGSKPGGYQSNKPSGNQGNKPGGNQGNKPGGNQGGKPEGQQGGSGGGSGSGGRKPNPHRESRRQQKKQPKKGNKNRGNQGNNMMTR